MEKTKYNIYGIPNHIMVQGVISTNVRVFYDIVNLRRMYILSMNGKLSESALKILAVDKK